MDLLTLTNTDNKDLLFCHIYSFPIFVLDTKLQEVNKIPKWNCCLKIGLFLGFSDEHSSLLSYVQNLTTGNISTQYHVAFDDLFQIVYLTGEY